MNDPGNLNKDEVIAAVVAACAVGVSSMITWYYRTCLENEPVCDRIIEACSTIAANVAKIAEVLSHSSNKVSIDDLYEEVMKIQGFDDEFLIEALDYLSSNDKKAKTFFMLGEKQRKIWLSKHLCAQRN